MPADGASAGYYDSTATASTSAAARLGLRASSHYPTTTATAGSPTTSATRTPTASATTTRPTAACARVLGGAATRCEASVRDHVRRHAASTTPTPTATACATAPTTRTTTTCRTDGAEPQRRTSGQDDSSRQHRAASATRSSSTRRDGNGDGKPVNPCEPLADISHGRVEPVQPVPDRRRTRAPAPRTPGSPCAGAPFDDSPNWLVAPVGAERPAAPAVRSPPSAGSGRSRAGYACAHAMPAGRIHATTCAPPTPIARPRASACGSPRWRAGWTRPSSTSACRPPTPRAGARSWPS